MDTKQFALFEQGVQWVADEQDRRLRAEDPTGLTHRQSWWAAGKVTDKTFNEGVVQYAVVCPTSCCLAGNFCSIAGDEFLAFRHDAIQVGSLGVVEARMVRTPEGNVRQISLRARELAGIEDDEARWLFDGDNSPDELMQKAKVVAANHGYDLRIM